MRNFSFFLFGVMVAGLIACSPARKIGKAQQVLLKDSALTGAHLGVSIYDPAKNKYLYNYQGDHYFIPASNTKLFTCYAAMKYLGDSLVGLRYQNTSDSVINIFPNGDPTFLHPDFDYQPVIRFLQQQKKQILIAAYDWQDNAFGKGWGWDDYNDYYMAERSLFPVSGNTIKAKLKDYHYTYSQAEPNGVVLQWQVSPNYFKEKFDTVSGLPLYIRAKFEMRDTGIRKKALLKFSPQRVRDLNEFNLRYDHISSPFSSAETPFITDGINTSIEILKKDYSLNIQKGTMNNNSLYGDLPDHLKIRTLHSQPTDSLLKPMMYRSDNFFAEQSLLMVSNEKLGYMKDETIIDTLLKNDLKDLPQPPVWVDGSGLSRYNQFTPQDLVTILLKIKNEFGLERIRNILPKGNTGTLSNYYTKIGLAIFAKTGTLSGQVALSGYLVCKSGKLLLFSILVNNHNSSGRAVRRAVEQFVLQVWKKN